MSNVGMMDAAFFVGKNELLSWLNDLLQLNYTKVEQCASGAAYCQIMDAIYPGEVPLKKVLFDAKLEHDFIKNYKVLQSVFDKKQITKHIEVNKLIKAKPLDNLEFLQWIKRYFDMHFGGHEYNALERRGGNACAKENGGSSVAGSKAAAQSTTSVAKSVKSAPLRTVAKDVSNVVGAASTSRPGSAMGKRAGGDEQVQQLQEELTSLKLTVAELEKERDFYFSKLRDVEIACQTTEKTVVAEFVEDVQRILYSTAEEPVEAT